ncbi:MAG TPA: exosortase/archaeosortase family protein [Gemmataceae bacterium]|jgi:exosortase
MSAGLVQKGECTRKGNPSRLLAFSLFLLAIALLLFLAFFGGNLLKLSDRWINDPSYAHGILVPFISLWLAVRAYRRECAPISGNIRLGCLAILTGAMLHLILTVISNAILDFVAAGLVLWGMAVAIGGAGWARAYLFPIGFLFFMFPLPATWTNFAGLWLQDRVAQVSAAVIDPLVVCYRRGNSLYLTGVSEPLVVAAECSGLRQIVSFVALAVLIGGLSRRSMAFRILLALVAIPLAILANVVRILLMAAGSIWFGTHWMGSWMHDAPALLTLPLGVAMLLVAVRGLNCFMPVSEARSVANAPPKPVTSGPGALKRGLQAVIVCLTGGLIAEGGLAWYAQAGGSPSYPDLRSSLAELPRELIAYPLGAKEQEGVWRGRDLPNLDEFRSKLPYRADELVYRQYEGGSAGPNVFLYMVYSRQGEDRKHHPEVCIRDASGATEDHQSRREVALDAEGQRTVMRFRFRTGINQLTTVYYWHYTLEAPRREGQTALRRLYQQQNHPVPSVTVQVSLMGGGKELETVEHGFLAAVDSALCRSQLPATARIGCQRLPITLVRE